MKEQSCPNCAGVDPEVINPGEFRCKFCGTLFYDKELQEQHRKNQQHEANIRTQQLREHAKVAQAGAIKSTGKRVLLFVGIFLVLIFSFVGYFAKKAMDDQQKMQDEIMNQQKELQEEMMKNFEK